MAWVLGVSEVREAPGPLLLRGNLPATILVTHTLSLQISFPTCLLSMFPFGSWGSWYYQIQGEIRQVSKETCCPFFLPPCLSVFLAFISPSPPFFLFFVGQVDHAAKQKNWKSCVSPNPATLRTESSRSGATRSLPLLAVEQRTTPPH